MNDCDFNEEKTKKLKKIWEGNPPPLVPKILLGFLFLGICPAGLVWVWIEVLPRLSKVFSCNVLLLIFVVTALFLCIFGIIPYLHQFFFYELFPDRFMGLRKGAWWDRGTARYDAKHKFTAKKNA